MSEIQSIVMAEIRVSLNGVDTPSRTIVLSRTFVVGRSDQCDLAADDRHLSREHCRFEFPPDTGGWVIVDNNSTNGTRVGTERIERHRLVDGDVVVAGPLRIEFRETVVSTTILDATEAPPTALKRSSKQSASETILDGIIAASQTSAIRFPATARRAKPQIGKPSGSPLLRKIGRDRKSKSISVADLLVSEVRDAEVEIPAKEEPEVVQPRPETTVSKTKDWLADDKNWRAWWLNVTAFFRRRLL